MVISLTRFMIASLRFDKRYFLSVLFKTFELKCRVSTQLPDGHDTGAYVPDDY